jgi:hypothetical protein
MYGLLYRMVQEVASIGKRQRGPICRTLANRAETRSDAIGYVDAGRGQMICCAGTFGQACRPRTGRRGWLAQPAERVVHTDEVTGSSPVPPTISKQSKLSRYRSGRQLTACFFIPC